MTLKEYLENCNEDFTNIISKEIEEKWLNMKKDEFYELICKPIINLSKGLYKYKQNKDAFKRVSDFYSKWESVVDEMNKDMYKTLEKKFN